jgi:CubicO group peptidase (beta-lactamase class C family)
LSNEGKLSLDDKAFKYMQPAFQSATGQSLVDAFPSALYNIEDVTIRELLSMRASLNDYNELAYQAQHPHDDIGPVETVQRYGISQPIGGLPLGSCGVYSSFGFVLLGLVLNGESGLAWDKYDQNVWRDSFPEIDFALHGPCSQYTDIQGECDDCADNGATPSGMSCTGGYTCGNMVATAEEVARFSRALFSGELLGSKTTQEMLTYHKLGPEGATGGVDPGLCSNTFGNDGLYGLGVEAHNNPDLPGHEGMTYGFTTLTQYDMRSEAAYVVGVPTSNQGASQMVSTTWQALRTAMSNPSSESVEHTRVEHIVV